MKGRNNMTKLKWFLIVTFALFILLAIVIGSLLYNGYLYNQKMVQKCTNYNPDWLGLDDCYGVISISHGFDTNGYLITDHVHGSYILAEVNYLNDYKFQNGKFFVKSREPIECRLSNGKYCQNLYQNNQQNTTYYDSQLDIPLYLIIDTETGNVNAYKSINEVSESDKKVFEELEKVK